MRYRALSLKQPWATLLVHCLKTIEVRRWSTRYRGQLLIHAARIADDRPQAWKLLPPHLADVARLEGGIIGVGMLTECKRYSNQDAFAADQSEHLNDPSWFEEKGLFGFCFHDLRQVAFHQVPGNVRLFGVSLDELVIQPATKE